MTERVLLGDDLLQLLVLAFGGALFMGNLMAVLRPREQARDESDLDQAPVPRSLAFAALGLIAALWAVATLLTK